MPDALDTADYQPLGQPARVALRLVRAVAVAGDASSVYVRLGLCGSEFGASARLPAPLERTKRELPVGGEAGDSDADEAQRARAVAQAAVE